MLFFLAIAAKNSFVVDEYIDDAVRVMERDEGGKMAMTRVTIRPMVKFSGDKRPKMKDLERIHHQSHEQCFIANSVKTTVVTELVPNDTMKSGA